MKKAKKQEKKRKIDGKIRGKKSLKAWQKNLLKSEKMEKKPGKNREKWGKNWGKLGNKRGRESRIKTGIFLPKPTLEEAPRVLLIQGQQLPRRFADFGQSEFHPPHLAFVPQPILPWKQGNSANSSEKIPLFPNKIPLFLTKIPFSPLKSPFPH